MQLGRPIPAAAFTARLDSLRIGDKFAIAVSGGRDSMALARLSADYGKKHGAHVAALIVDHGLREASSHDAAQAKAWCENAGLEAQILTWRGAKPKSTVQETARHARYFLLAQAANDLDFPVVLTAHSADDQVETFLMRLARGAGPAGLAAMDDDIEIAAAAGAPVRLARPLLAFSRDDLTATVEEFHQDYLDDPSNEDQQFERVRARRFLAHTVREGILDPAAILRSAQRMGALRQRARDADICALRALGGVFTRWGGAALEVSMLAAHDDPYSAVAGLIRAVSGADHRPDVNDVSRQVRAALERGGAAIGGALLRRAGGRLWVVREPAAILGRAGVPAIADVEIPAGGAILWDKRFILKSAQALTVRPLGTPGVEALGRATALFEGPRDGLAGTPGLYVGERLIGAPGLLSGEGGFWSAVSLASERFSRAIVRFPQVSGAAENTHGAGLS